MKTTRHLPLLVLIVDAATKPIFSLLAWLIDRKMVTRILDKMLEEEAKRKNAKSKS